MNIGWGRGASQEGATFAPLLERPRYSIIGALAYANIGAPDYSNIGAMAYSNIGAANTQ